MNRFDEPTDQWARGLTRRRLLRRVGGGLAGATIASLGLGNNRSAQAQAGPISLRDLLGRISAQGCDPSRGIRALLPNDHPVISIRDVARRYAGRANLCQPPQLSVRNEKIAAGDRVHIDGENFTPGGQANILFESDSGRNNFSFSVLAQSDGTFSHVRDLGCGLPEKLFVVWATDVGTGRRAGGSTVAYDCPPPPPSGGGGTTRPSISVSQQGSAAGARFIVKGTGFLSNHRVHIRVTNNSTLISGFAQTSSDAAGGINYGIDLPCDPPVGLSFSANDERAVPTSQDLTGILWSNTVTVTCS